MGVVMGEEKVRVPSRVLEEIEAVRQSGHAEMNDHPLVSFVANHLGYRDTAEWIYWHKKEYAEGVSRGFYTDPNADAVEEATPCWSVAASIVLRARNQQEARQALAELLDSAPGIVEFNVEDAWPGPS